MNAEEYQKWLSEVRELNRLRDDRLKKTAEIEKQQAELEKQATELHEKKN